MKILTTSVQNAYNDLRFKKKQTKLNQDISPHPHSVSSVLLKSTDHCTSQNQCFHFAYNKRDWKYCTFNQKIAYYSFYQNGKRK